jgi:hypothetical protein
VWVAVIKSRQNHPTTSNQVFSGKKPTLFKLSLSFRVPSQVCVCVCWFTIFIQKTFLLSLDTHTLNRYIFFSTKLDC